MEHGAEHARGEHVHPHETHGHGGHSHGGPVTHGASPESLAAYADARQSAQPEAGGSVVRVELDAREIEWEFVPGTRTRAWSYGGEVPGPVLRANVGDVLEVHFTNRLPEPTTLHWHGLTLPAPMDGTDMVQHPVAPGETFVYRYLLRDAGTFWYHPHMNEAVQLERGLAGAIVVRGAGEPVLDAERVLVLDDVTLDADGQVAAPGSWIEQHDGRQGTVRLVNGRQEPGLDVAAGQVERWRIVNVASARYVRLSIGGREFTILGTDGGLIAAPYRTREVLLAPADRVDLAVGPFAEGETVPIVALAYERGSVARAADEPFGTIRVGSARPSHASIPGRLRDIMPLASAATAATREVRLGVRASPREGAEFVINDEVHFRDEPVRVGELQVWDLVNESHMDHPFHLHGFFFQVVAVDGTPPAFLSWEDTINVAPRSRVRIAWKADDRPGEWMYHCHILEHHAAGMMAHVAVIR
jgi:FtsP/CotA-like multicopper oxidase with cupredoxin domain